MVYLEKFKLLSDYEEHTFATDERKIFISYYPLHIFPLMNLENINFSDITIFYGDNGSGKSTLLNIIASKLEAITKSFTDKGPLFGKYLSYCDYEMGVLVPDEIKAITSDDVFDYLLDVRSINSNVNRRKMTLSREWLTNKYDDREESIFDYQKIKNNNDARRKTSSMYIKERLANNNILEHSNGESALLFWEREIKENGIYILDEPENSLSPLNQIKLKQFIEDSQRFYNCQFIISTHSPFLLALKDALIYDLDSRPCTNKKWTELSNVKLTRDFFKEHDEEFDYQN